MKHYRITKKITVLAIVFMVCLTYSLSFAEVKPAAIFSDHMVLQRDMAVPIWGTAQPGEEVTVSFAGQTEKTKADSTGKWMIKLKPLKVGHAQEMTVSGENTVKFTDVLVGEVWLCSGQSNMALKVGFVMNAKQEIEVANYPNIRFNSGPGWQPCNPETVRDFSAAGYFFGRELYKNLNVPIGLINRSHGGTPIEKWTPRETLLKTKYVKEMFQKLPNTQPDEDEQEPQENADNAKDENNKKTNKDEVSTVKYYQSLFSTLYVKNIQPLIPYAIRGTIWYQGETNASYLGGSLGYRELFPGMINAWRKAWGQGDFPFLYVQLPNWKGGNNWPLMRESMLKTLATPNTGMAVTIDIGNSLHPANKQDVGKRLSLWALKTAYGKDIVASGPLYKSMEIKDGKIILRFDSIGTGLVAKNGELTSFAIAGDNKDFKPATAKIEGDKIIVWSDSVTKPVAIRYAWENNPKANLYNKENLPASPFRTDSWEVFEVKRMGK